MRSLIFLVLCCSCSINRPDPCAPTTPSVSTFCVDNAFSPDEIQAASDAAAYWTGRSCSGARLYTLVIDGGKTPPPSCDWTIYRVASYYDWVATTTEPNVGGFCDVNLEACWIVADRIPEFLRAQVFAHEMGHALAQRHTDVATRGEQ